MPTTTRSGAGPSPTTAACSRSSASRASSPACRWLTILRKRENFRARLRRLRLPRLARFGDADVERLLGDAGIVRHRGKIESTLNNARRAVELAQEAGSLAAFVWRFAPAPRAGRAPRLGHAARIAKTPESTALSKELKRRGWSFVGPTTVYAFMQAMGLVNDHVEGCAVRAEAEADRRASCGPVEATSRSTPDATPDGPRLRSRRHAGRQRLPARPGLAARPWRPGIELSVWRIHRRIGMSGGLFTNALLRETGSATSTQPACERLQQRHAAAHNRPSRARSARCPARARCWPT